MRIIAVSGEKGQGKTLTASLLPMHLKEKRCFIISYYDAVDCISPGISKCEYDAVKEIIVNTCPDFFIDAVKLKKELYKGIYDILIIDDVDTETAAEKLKAEFGAIIIGVVKYFPYSVPYKARDELMREVIGSPDIVIKNQMTMNRLQAEITEAVRKLNNGSFI